MKELKDRRDEGIKGCMYEVPVCFLHSVGATWRLATI